MLIAMTPEHTERVFGHLGKLARVRKRMAADDCPLDPRVRLELAFQQRDRPLEQIDGAWRIASGEGPPPGRAEDRAGGCPELAVTRVQRSEGRAVTVRLLEVVADDLLHFDRPLTGVGVQPCRHAFMEVGPGPLR